MKQTSNIKTKFENHEMKIKDQNEKKMKT